VSQPAAAAVSISFLGDFVVKIKSKNGNGMMFPFLLIWVNLWHFLLYTMVVNFMELSFPFYSRIKATLLVVFHHCCSSPSSFLGEKGVKRFAYIVIFSDGSFLFSHLCLR
jgi:hypothetical protein